MRDKYIKYATEFSYIIDSGKKKHNWLTKIWRKLFPPNKSLQGLTSKKIPELESLAKESEKIQLSLSKGDKSRSD